MASLEPENAGSGTPISAPASLFALAAALLVLLLIAAGCASDDDVVTSTPVRGIFVADGLQVSQFATGFNRPTQIAAAGSDQDRDQFVIAELNGAEGAGTGRILLFTPGGAAPQILQEGLVKPTGVAVIDGQLWIMEEDRLSVTSLIPGADREIVFDDLPTNGRSEGTLTVTPDGDLLFDTSGSKRGSTVVDGSGTLFQLDVTTRERTVVATGLKHAYAHVVDSSGQLWSVEMTDGKFDGTAASDELMKVSAGDDFAWPFCVENNRVVAQFGATQAQCEASPPSHALFGPGATPTSIVVAPWDDQLLVVTLWFTGEVVTVPRTDNPTGEPWTGDRLLTGIEHPQHLLAHDGALLVVDHTDGRILAVAP